MTARVRYLAPLVAALATLDCSGTRSGAASQGSEQAARSVIYAMYANDSADFERRIVPELRSTILLGRKHYSTDELRALRHEVDALQLRRDQPFTVGGKPIAGTDESRFPEGTKTVYRTEFRGNNLAIPVERVGTEWKADVRFWLAMARMRERKQDAASPEMRAKEFLFYVLSAQPSALDKVSAEPIDGHTTRRRTTYRPETATRCSRPASRCRSCARGPTRRSPCRRAESCAAVDRATRSSSSG